jgi:hypothetical protein
VSGVVVLEVKGDDSGEAPEIGFVKVSDAVGGESEAVESGHLADGVGDLAQGHVEGRGGPLASGFGRV